MCYYGNMQKEMEENRSLRDHEGEDGRIQHEMRQMKTESDLDEIDDDVERAATLYEWEALEHRDHPHNPRWFTIMAIGITISSAVFLLFANIIGALAVALIGTTAYWILRQHPKDARYRIMVDGVAINSILHHYRDLESFNVIYEPNQAQLVVLKSKRSLAPLLTMELGDETDPSEIRDLLLEFLPEDQELDEPFIDAFARRIGF